MKAFQFGLAWLSVGVQGNPAARGETMEIKVVYEVDAEAIRPHEWFVHMASPMATWETDHIFFIYPGDRMNPQLVHLSYDGGATADLVSNTTLHEESVWFMTEQQYSIGIDELGFVHAAGEMDDWPFHYNAPKWPPEGSPCLVWRSSVPLGTSTMEFRGAKSDHCFPGQGFSHVKYFNDNEGRLYAHYRVTTAVADPTAVNTGDVPRGIMLARYDVTTESWISLGAEVLDEGSAGHVAVVYEVSRPAESRVNDWPSRIMFDDDDVLHLFTMSNGEEQMARLPTYAVYLYSDDYGLTWKDSSNNVLNLPLRVTAAEESKRPEIIKKYASEPSWPWCVGGGTVDGQFTAFYGEELNQHYHVSRRRAEGGWADYSAEFAEGMPSPERYEFNPIYSGPDGVATMVWHDGIRRFWDHHDMEFHRFEQGEELGRVRVEPAYFRRTGRMLAMSDKFRDWGATLETLKVVVVDFTREPTTTAEPTREPTTTPDPSTTLEPTTTIWATPPLPEMPHLTGRLASARRRTRVPRTWESLHRRS